MNERRWQGFFTRKMSIGRLARSIAFIYVTFAVIIYFTAERLMFHPDFASREPVAGGVLIPTADGERISAVHRPAPFAKYTILMSHGNAESLPDMAYFFERLNVLGFSVFAYDYRGYGLSEGRPTEQNTYEDIDAAYRYLTDTLKIPADRIIAYGRSIGGGPGTWLAAREAVAGLILESTFVTAFRVRTRIPILPFDKFPNASRLPDVRGAVLVMHSADDEIIGKWHGEALFKAANEPKLSLMVERGGHGGIPFVYALEYAAALRDFVTMIESSGD